MRKIFAVICSLMLAVSLVLSGCSTSNENASQTTEIFTYGDEEKAYVAQVEENSVYGLDITQRLLENKSNEHGYRTAGSQAEFEAGEMLVKEFESIGLQNVHKDAFTTDGWEYREGEITFTSAENESYTAVLGGHAVQFQADNETYEVVYANRGTADDLAELDVNGKWVLVDIDQSSDWWVNYPAYQAYLKGAAGVLAINVAGYPLCSTSRWTKCCLTHSSGVRATYFFLNISKINFFPFLTLIL